MLNVLFQGLNLTDEREDNDEIHIFAGNLHAHYRGRRVKGRHFRYKDTYSLLLMVNFCGIVFGQISTYM